MSLVAALHAGWGRAYFAVQSAAGGAWWVTVALSPGIRHLTLGDLPAGVLAFLDVPLFVGCSALAAAGIRWVVWVAASWTAAVAVGLSVYATLTGQAGWGALLMILAAIGSVGGALLVLLGRIPAEWLLVGPFAAREARPASRRANLLRTAGQIVIFWGLFLVVIPMSVAQLGRRWALHADLPAIVPLLGAVVLTAATALGLWSAAAMAGRGGGTPLPRTTATVLVVSGPYRHVRNPMAIAGIAQGVAVGMLLESWLVIGYALCGSLVWNHLIRPGEEADLLTRFGASYARYRDSVSCWIPRRPRRARPGSEAAPLVY